MDYFRDFNLITVAIRLLFAALCGGLLGFNREKRRNAAGIRTYYIVCLGSACAMLLGQYLNYMVNSVWSSFIYDVELKTDVSRIAAMVVSGIGFLGTGTILLTKNNQVKGLTSAAGILTCACLGLSIGIGFYEIAIIGFVILWISLDLFYRVDSKAREKRNKLRFVVKISDQTKLARMLEAISNAGAKIIEYDYLDDDKSNIDIKLNMPDYFTITDFISTMYMLDCVESIKRL